MTIKMFQTEILKKKIKTKYLKLVKFNGYNIIYCISKILRYR